MQASFGEQPDRLRIQAVLLDQDRSRDKVSSVSAGSTGTATCSTMGPVSTPSSMKCTVAPAHLGAVVERLTLGVKAREGRAAARGGCSGAAGEGAHVGGREDPHEAGVHDEPDAARAQLLHEGQVEGLAIAEVLRIDPQGLDAGGPRVLKREARSRSEITTATRAGSPARAAARIACRLDPRPEARTPTGPASRRVLPAGAMTVRGADGTARRPRMMAESRGKKRTSDQSSAT